MIKTVFNLMQAMFLIELNGLTAETPRKKIGNENP